MTLPSLAHLAPGADQPTGRGGDPELVWAEYRGIIQTAIHGQARSQQKRIGPSELGIDCLLCLGRKLAGIPEQRDEAWLPWIGTALHTQLEETFTAFNAALPAGEVRFLVETTVSVGDVDGTEITGHADLFDLTTASVTDWKCVGATTLRSARSGPSQTYRRQAHLYGRGFTRRGLPVDRVRIAYLPRNAVSLDQAVIWSEPYDEQIALDTLTRADGIAKALRLAGTDTVLASLPTAPGCHSCSRYPNSDGSMPSKPGHRRDPLHDLVA